MGQNSESFFSFKSNLNSFLQTKREHVEDGDLLHIGDTNPEDQLLIHRGFSR